MADCSETVILLDWDDTLLASTWVAKHGLRPRYCDERLEIPEPLRRELAELEEFVLELLHRASLYGRVVIVTAAETGWVELSASLFLPRCLDVIQSSVRVVSARSNYEAIYPDSPMQWKLAAFHHEVFLNSRTPRHVISLGDSTSEREALIAIADMEESIRGKSLKFITRPTLEELKQQVELVLSHLEYMCTHDGSLDLQLSKHLISA